MAVQYLPFVAQAPPEPRLVIPDLELDEAVVPVPIEAGRWAADTLGQAVGWLPTTGAGPAGKLAPVIIGHVSQRSGASGPFGYLWRLSLNAEVIYIWQGQPYTYRVEEKRLLKPDAVDDIYVADGQRLLLVTCDGWDFTQWTYTQRLIVEARLVEAPAAP